MDLIKTVIMKNWMLVTPPIETCKHSGCVVVSVISANTLSPLEVCYYSMGKVRPISLVFFVVSLFLHVVL